MLCSLLATQPGAPLRAVLTATATAASLLCCAALAPCAAQTVPDAGSLLRESQQAPPRVPALPPVAQPRQLQDSGVKVTVKRFIVSGSSRFDAARFDALFADLLATELGFAQLQAAADRVATLYRQNGLHATAYLPEQDLKDGSVRIVVVEGRFGRLRSESGGAATPRRAVPRALIERMVGAGQVRGEMLDITRLERGTLIANDVPGVRVSALLAAGEAPGETDVVLKIDERPLLSGAATLDNQDARATGAVKAGLALALGSPAGWGDQAQFAANATEGKRYLRAAYDVPLGASGLRAGLNASTMRYTLRGEFAASGGNGRATTVAATGSVPLLRGIARNLYASASLERRHLVNDSSAGKLSDKTTLALALGVNGDATDGWLGGGAWLGGTTLTTGRLDLAGNVADAAADAAGPQRAGRYAKLAANLGRLQRVSNDGSVWLNLSGQRASKNLDSGEQFSIGGAYAVRAYPSIEGSGDHGWLATAEYRLRVNDALQLSAFYDHGQVTREHTPQPASAEPGRYALKGVGIGAEWTVAERVTLRAAIANRVGSNPAAGPTGQDGDGTKRRPRVWASLSVPF